MYYFSDYFNFLLLGIMASTTALPQGGPLTDGDLIAGNSNLNARMPNPSTPYLNTTNLDLNAPKSGSPNLGTSSSGSSNLDLPNPQGTGDDLSNGDGAHGAPEGYQVGFSTQDNEPAGQQSICQTSCGAGQLGGTTSSGANPGEGIYAAAINPAMGGGSADCGPCGSCYSIINSGQPYCSPGDSGCPTPSGPSNQGGQTSEIKVLITNHCTNCDEVAGHFDINNAPGDWNNPKIYWKQLDPSECH